MPYYQGPNGSGDVIVTKRVNDHCEFQYPSDPQTTYATSCNQIDFNRGGGKSRRRQKNKKSRRKTNRRRSKRT